MQDHVLRTVESRKVHSTLLRQFFYIIQTSFQALFGFLHYIRTNPTSGGPLKFFLRGLTSCSSIQRMYAGTNKMYAVIYIYIDRTNLTNALSA